MSNISQDNTDNIMEDIQTFYRERVIMMYNTLNHFKNSGIPVADNFWNNISLAHAQIQNGLEYNPMVIRGTAGLHAELSVSPSYNPFQIAYDSILSGGLSGWENRINLENAYSGTSYYMFRLQDEFYLVWVNSQGEINQLNDSFMSEITLPDVEPAADVTEVPGDTGSTVYQ